GTLGQRRVAAPSHNTPLVLAAALMGRGGRASGITRPFMYGVCFVIHPSGRPRTAVLGIEARAGGCGRCVLSRRAYGNLRVGSGGDHQAPNDRVSRSQQTSVCLVRRVRPRNPAAQAVGRVNLEGHRTVSRHGWPVVWLTGETGPRPPLAESPLELAF